MTQSREDKLYRQNNHYTNLLTGLKESMQRVQADNVSEMTRLTIANWVQRMKDVEDRVKEINDNGGM